MHVPCKVITTTHALILEEQETEVGKEIHPATADDIADYSKNPLWKKLTIIEGQSCYLFNSPSNYFDILEGVPEETTWSEDSSKGPFDFMHAFLKEESV